MASTELHITNKRSAEILGSDDVEQINKREGNAKSAFTLTLPFVEEAPEVHAQTDLLKDSPKMLQHTNSSPHIPANNNVETSLLDFEVCQSKRAFQENVCNVNMPEVNTIGETALNFCTSKLQKFNLETDEAQNQNLEDVANTEKELLLKDLKLLHCPFTWNLDYKNTRKTTTERIIAICDEKLKLLEEEIEDASNEEFEWHKFVVTLVLCHEHYMCRNFSEALAKQQECESLIISCESSEKSDVFFNNIKEALWHVVNACKCHLLVSLNKFSDAMKLMHGITRYEDMKNNSKAAIFGIQAAMLLEYGYDGTKAALEYAKQAVTLDENEAEWNFLYGKILGRIRHAENFNEIPTEKELSVLEKAATKSKKASHMVFLAEACRVKALKTYAKNQMDRNLNQKTVYKMFKKSVELYCQALELNGESACINMRCASGLLKLPTKFQDLQKAKECIEKALNIAASNPMVNHVAGNIYEECKQIDLAEKFYEKASELDCYGAHMDLLRIKMKKDRKYDPLPHLNELLQLFTEDIRVQRTILTIGSYYFYERNDVFTALEYWMKGIEINPYAPQLKEHKCGILAYLKVPVNLYQVIVDEIHLALEQETLNVEIVDKLEKMRHYCTEICPDLLSKPQSWRQLPNEKCTKTQIRNWERSLQHKSKISEQWENVTQKEHCKGSYAGPSTSSRVDLDDSKKHEYTNKGHPQLLQHENGINSPKNVSFSNETCDIRQQHADSMSNGDSAPVLLKRNI